MKDGEIITLYYKHPNMTLEILSRMSGKPLSYLRKLFMGKFHK